MGTFRKVLSAIAFVGLVGCGDPNAEKDLLTGPPVTPPPIEVPVKPPEPPKTRLVDRAELNRLSTRLYVTRNKINSLGAYQIQDSTLAGERDLKVEEFNNRLDPIQTMIDTYIRGTFEQTFELSPDEQKLMDSVPQLETDVADFYRKVFKF
jgi:hypothetical protein